MYHDSLISQRVLNTKKQQATVAKGTVGAMMMSTASLGLNILQDMSEPVFEMKFESLPPASKVGYRYVLLTLSTGTLELFSWIQVHMLAIKVYFLSSQKWRKVKLFFSLTARG